ncbi:Peroxiredoxin AHP1 [Nakaseomyces bracarensis]|uniref:Peroxiredoxin AHP1 n=1 Tax=Nakaseomyces bracarensis TaxID=273131 RepID=A0ABR4NM79_9SACH
MAPKVNEKLDVQNFKFQYINIDESESHDACGMPTAVSWSDFLAKNKTVVITGAPAAFSPTCSISHIPGYVSKLKELEAKGVDQVVVVTVDNPFANQAWAKKLGITNTKHIKFATDGGAQFTKSLGYELDVGEGVYWSGRWTVIVKDGVVTYCGKETNPGTDVTVSSVEEALKHL